MELVSLSVLSLTAAIIIAVILVIIALVCSILGIGTFGHIFVKGLWAMLLIPAVLVYGGLIERNIFKVKEVNVSSPKLPSSFDGYKIVHISDLHLRSFAHRSGALERAVKKINAIQPDLICFSGDLVTMSASEIEPLKEILVSLKARDGVVSVLGNHDYCVYNYDKNIDKVAETERVRATEREMGWRLLDDENITLRSGKDSISVIGVQNISASPRYPSSGDLAKAMKGAEGEYKILVSHDPTHWRSEVLGMQDIDLMLSGHTHSMQFSLFGWSPSSYIFRENNGLYSEVTSFGTQYLYVNPGLGETIMPLRVGVVPEITVIVCHSESSK